MTPREVPVSSLFGRRVHDAKGRHIGRLVEIEARIVLLGDRSEYVATTYHVSHYGIFDWMAGSVLVQQLVERLGERVGYRCLYVPAAHLELTQKLLKLKETTGLEQNDGTEFQSSVHSVL